MQNWYGGAGDSSECWFGNLISSTNPLWVNPNVTSWESWDGKRVTDPLCFVPSDELFRTFLSVEGRKTVKFEFWFIKNVLRRHMVPDINFTSTMKLFFFVGWILRQTVHELIFIESGKPFFWNWVSFHEMEQFNLLKDSYLMLQSPSYWIKVKRESKFQNSIMIRMLLQNVMFCKFFIGSCFVSGTNWIGKISLHNFPKGQFRKDVWELFRWRI